MAYTTIDDPSAHFHTQLYTGNATDDTDITNSANAGDFQPDLVWIKNRTGGADWHDLTDSTRGVTKSLFSNNTNNEDTATDSLQAFLADGFTIGSNTQVNRDTNNYVAWQWKANGSSRTTFTESGANPAGGYQVNTTAGFSIIDYTGTGTNGGTVAHGLGATPTIAIIKNRDDDGTNFIVAYTISDGSSDRMYLQDTNVKYDLSGTEFRVDFNSTNVTLGTWGDVNDDGKKFIGYVFTPIQGYSKFGGYTGNANADGTFVYTGFKPAYVMVKGASNVSSWNIHDNKRQTYNDGTIPYFYANGADAEITANANMDFVSNGFKLRTHDNDWNGANTYIYMAFAESPFVTSGGVPCTAR